MIKRFLRSAAVLLFLLTSCSAAPETALEPILVQYSFTSRPWLETLFNCAGDLPLMTELRPVNQQDPGERTIALRVGEQGLTGPAYQVASEELVVILNPNNPIRTLTAAQVLDLFTGRVSDWEALDGAPGTVQAWSFAPGEDLSQIFVQNELQGLAISSLSRLAATPEDMLAAIRSDENAIGYLTRGLLTEAVKPVYTSTPVPVLILLPDSLLESTSGLLACMQQ